MKKKRILYVVSQIDRAIEFELIAQKINHDRFDLSFVLLNNGPSEFVEYCKAHSIEHRVFQLRGKKSFPLLFLRLWVLFLCKRPHVVHTHLFEASILALSAAKCAFIRSRIYTRHHSTYHHEYFPQAVKWDLRCNRMATHVVAISQNVKNILVQKENVDPSKIEIIYHGFDIHAFQETNEAETATLCQKYNPEGKHPVIGVVSRFTHLKGVRYIIPAFKQYLSLYPDAKLLLFNSFGDQQDEILALLNSLPEGSWKCERFEKNIYALYSLFDFFIHVPINKEVEAFGQTYIEALAAGVPSVFTLSGIASECISSNKNAMVVDFCNSEQIYEALLTLSTNTELRNEIIKNGYLVSEKFKIEHCIYQLELLYEK